MKNRFLVLPLLLISSCATVDTTWLREIDGNEFEVSSGRLTEGRFITVDNKLRTWNGQFRGGEEKVELRKEFLTKLAEQEAATLCSNSGFEKKDEPNFGMTDTNPMAFGGGLLGVLVAEAVSSYDNLPVSIHYRFKCDNDSLSDNEELEVKK